MDLPHAQLLAPVPLVDAPSALRVEQRVAAIRGTRELVRAAARLPELESLWITGVGADVAAAIGELHRLRALVVHDLRTPDLVAFSKLARLGSLSIAGSPKLRSIAGVEGLGALKRFILFDCPNVSDVEPLAGLASLETLCLEGGFSKELRLASLKPLAGLTGLVELRLASLRVEDGSLRPLHALRALRSVFVAKTFDAEELRALADALPAARV